MILSSPAALGHIPTSIISLVPSQTELLFHLELEEETIAITKFCVHPETWYRNKTRIGGTKTLDIEKIIGLSPGLIIANKEENIKEQVETLAEHFPVWVTDVTDLDSAMKMVNDIGALAGRTAQAKIISQHIYHEFAELEQEVAAFYKKPLRTAYLIWKDPYMTVGAGTFIDDMMRRCGLINIFAHATRYPETDTGQLKEMDCELLLLSSEPYPFAEKHIAELEAVFPGIPILLVDGEMFSWYGSRLLLSPAYFKQLALRMISHTSQNS